MNPVRVSAKPFNGYFPGSRREYLGFIRLVLKYADTVCFTVCPYLDNPGELGSSIWSCLSDSVLDYGFAQAVSYPPDVRHCLVLFRKDYCLCEFLQSRKGIFDFEEEDPVLGILPVAAIYGANASGKSNIYHAFEYMAAYVAESFKYGDEEEKFEIEKLAHDADNKKEETYKISSLHKKIDSDAFAAIPLGMESAGTLKMWAMIDKCLEMTAYDAQYRLPWIPCTAVYQLVKEIRNKAGTEEKDCARKK